MAMQCRQWCGRGAQKGALDKTVGPIKAMQHGINSRCANVWASQPPGLHLELKTSRSIPTRRLQALPEASQAPQAPSQAWNAPPVCVVGAGIGGLASALALHRVGIPVVVLEAASDGARVGEGAAIGLWDNAWRALDVLGVAKPLRPKYLRLNRVELCRSTGKLLRGFGFSETEAGAQLPRSQSVLDPVPAGLSSDASGAGSEFRGVRRSDLIRTLAAALPPGTIRGGATVARVSTTGGASAWPSVALKTGEVIEASVVIGADGARSVVAAAGTGLGLPAANYSGYAAYRGVAELPGGIASINLPPNTIRQVWGQGVRAGLYPLDDTSVYWFTCFNAPQDAPVPATPAGFQSEALSHVKGWSWGLETAISCTPPEAISRSRIVDRWTAGAFGQGLVTLCGDAAHPMTPNLGQGGCVALEDAVVLARAIASVKGMSPGSVPAALEAALRDYEQDRSSRCLPLTVRSYIMGFLLQLPFDLVCLTRDWFVSTLFPPSHFLDHTMFDCGPLPVAAPAQTTTTISST